MKIAVLNSNGVSQDFEYQKRYYYLVENAYDFDGNSATDVTDIVLLKKFFGLNRMTLTVYRDSVNYHYVNVLSSDWNSSDSSEKKILSELFLVDKSKRDVIFTDEDQQDLAKDLVDLIEVDNKKNEASVIYSQDSIESYIDKSNNVSFGKDYYYAENDFEENTNSSWENHAKLSLTDLQDGKYRASWYCEINGSATNKRVQARVRLDSTTDIGEHLYEPEDSQDWVSFSGFKRIDVSGGTLVIDIDYGRHQTGTTARIRNARIELWRVE